tara:strand:+ start:7784 stop:7993 length:210 start_codon:yes stop_codon:yes gene_type:complete
MKKAFLSKTMWFNAAAVLLSVANNYGQVLPDVDQNIQVGAIAGVNLLLRLVTSQPLDLTGVVSDLLRRR